MPRQVRDPAEDPIRNPDINDPAAIDAGQQIDPRRPHEREIDGVDVDAVIKAEQDNQVNPNVEASGRAGVTAIGTPEVKPDHPDGAFVVAHDRLGQYAKPLDNGGHIILGPWDKGQIIDRSLFVPEHFDRLVNLGAVRPVNAVVRDPLAPPLPGQESAPAPTPTATSVPTPES